MAFCRFAPGSDVYVYEDTRGGFTCENCKLASVGEPGSFRCGSAAEVVDHLRAHRARGDLVPEDAIEELDAEVTSGART